MTAGIKEKITDYLNRGCERTVLAKKNIAASFAVKGLTLLISFILIPMTINYVNPERNGIWLTLYSLAFWLNMFDIGLGNGMKNRLAEARAQGNDLLARKYVSSAYAILGLICLGVALLFCLVNPFLDWIKILKTVPAVYAGEVSALIRIIFISFCLTFILNLLKQVIAADQRPAIASFIDMLGQLLTLAGIFILTKTVPPSLVSLGWVTGFAPVAVLLVAGIVLFNTRYRAWRPSFRFVDFRVAGNMMNLGVKFFIATCSSLLVMQSLPILIQRIAGPVEVTGFNVAFKIFSVALNIVGIIILPYWSSFTDAYAQNDYEWMRKNVRRLQQFFLSLLAVQVIVLVLSPVIYYLWINYWIKDSSNALDISFGVSASVCLFVCTLCWLNTCVYPLNGIGKVQLQVYSSIAEILLFIPAVWYFGKMWGMVGVILSPVAVYFPRMIWSPVQLRKLIRNEAAGIWNR
ncbi:MAG: lipopolysaccharide biosynthesis protein [Dysgonamonadaceae bacterium]|jgi:O-antigen/teichoic acid export membrane protein|nr:lipopolysaccharide biosynthesis protein [Dysgonamonadaceae bacterium]